jgi:DNA-binding winged helix-turn-helix (wHTH) protein
VVRVTALPSKTDDFIDDESGVAVLQWPERQDDVEALARRGIPRLLLVAPRSAAPVCTDPLEDWARLPVADADLRARLLTLAERQRARTPPTVDEHGVLRQDSTLVLLSPYEQRLAAVLIESFGQVVSTEVIERRLWNEFDPSRLALRVYASRLRKRVAPLGLTISCVVSVGYVMYRDADITVRSRSTVKRGDRGAAGSAVGGRPGNEAG